MHTAICVGTHRPYRNLCRDTQAISHPVYTSSCALWLLKCGVSQSLCIYLHAYHIVFGLHLSPCGFDAWLCRTRLDSARLLLQEHQLPIVLPLFRPKILQGPALLFKPRFTVPILLVFLSFSRSNIPQIVQSVFFMDVLRTSKCTRV